MTERQPATSSDEPMRVLLGYDAALTGMSGIARYVRQLAGELDHSADVAVTPLSGTTPVAHRPAPSDVTDAIERPNWRQTARRRVAGLAMRSPWSAAAYFKLRGSQFSRGIDTRDFDLVHEPNYVVRGVDLPTVVTIHDMSVYSCPSMHPRARVTGLRREIPHAVARARRIITLSRFSAREIERHLPQARGRIDVIPIGVDDVFRPRTAAETEPFLARYGLAHKSFLLFVGTFEPRKNLEGVLKAMTLLPSAKWRDCPLVVVGGGGWLNAELNDSLGAEAERGHVRLLGRVDDQELAALYAAARGVVFPSFYEGQGLPALEAAVSGVPVLTSEDTPMAELLGPIGLLVDPHEPDSIAAALRRLTEDQEPAELAAEQASTIKQGASWSSCVTATINAYRRALDA